MSGQRGTTLTSLLASRRRLEDFFLLQTFQYADMLLIISGPYLILLLQAGCDEIWEKICSVQGKDPSVDFTQVLINEKLVGH